MVEPRRDAPVRDWRRRSSPLARVALFAYTLLVIDASLYPFVGWRDKGIGPFDYLLQPWPAHTWEFDVIVNVLGYLPLGLLVVFAVYPKIRGIPAGLLGTLLPGMLAALMEATQTYLPTRVSSNVDLVTNTAGAFCGALLGCLIAEPALDRGRLMELRLRWFEREASYGLIIGLLWFAAVLYPEPFAFALGGILRGDGETVPWVQSLLQEPSVLTFVVLEVAITAAIVGGAGLLFENVMRPLAPRVRFVLAFIVLSGLARTFGAGLTYAPTAPFAWCTRGAFEGLVIAAVILLVALHLTARIRALLGAVLLAVGLVLVNIVPDNPYYDAALHDWAHGKLLNFYGLALGISLAWPFVALAYLARAAIAPRRV